MSTWRRRSLPCIWLALLPYLTMTGVELVHSHGVFDPELRDVHSIMTNAPEADCPLCAWHVLAVTSLALDAVSLCFPTSIILAQAPSIHCPHQVTRETHARGPPRRG